HHFHADPWDHCRAVLLVGPAGGDPQPAAGVFVLHAFAVPVELDLDPTVRVAMDLFTRRAADDGVLAAKDARFGMLERRAKRHQTGDRFEVVLVSLTELAALRGAVAVLFQHLRLFAFMSDG